MSRTGEALAHLGNYTLLVGETARQAVRPPIEWRRILYDLDQLGVRSLSIVNITALFTGMVLALQTSYALSTFGADLFIAEIVALSVVRELGPVLTALLVAGRVGSGIAAEIGSMVVTDQIDAIRTLGASPIKKVVVPKVVATMVMLPCLTVLADIVGILGGLLMSVVQLNVTSEFYFSHVREKLVIGDVTSGLAKSLFFGFAIATIGCYNGLRTTGGADGVGRATTQTVVQASITVLIGDFFLTKLFLSL
jgi:phospholipid/cholesterol/gamma-HCH transport system permease protein